MKPVIFDFDRSPGEYPGELLGYNSDLALFRSLKDNKLYQSSLKAFDDHSTYCIPGVFVSEEDGKRLLCHPKMVRTPPYILHPKKWKLFVDQQARFDEGQVSFVWEISKERAFYDEQGPLLFADREHAERVFMKHCRYSHEASYSDAVADGDENAEVWKHAPLKFERTEISTVGGCDRSERDFDGYVYGWLHRKELYL